MVEEFREPDAAADPTFQYLTGQMNPRQPALLAELQRRSAEAVNVLRPALDLPYGPHPRQRFDFFKTSWVEATFVYFHAGYWQARDKSQFRFIAPELAENGFNVALVNYPLCPDATLEALTEAVRDFVPVVRGLEGVVAVPLIVAGHSAGAHLAVELALTDWAARGVPANPISGVAGLSGIYDLEPLVVTPINDNLRLDVPAARAASPIHRVRGGLPRALFAVGGLETPAFRSQNAEMCAAWERYGNPGSTLVVDDADHFSLLGGLTERGEPLFDAVIALGRNSGR
ncbi:MAG TPA: alpha/beta hydrolase [Roseiarcus sp.]|jgi:arylformamidase